MNLMVLENLSRSKYDFFPHVLPLEVFIGCFCMSLKLQCMQKARGFKLHVTYANFTCIYIDQQHFLSWYGRYSQKFLILFIHYSMPFYFLLYVSW